MKKLVSAALSAAVLGGALLAPASAAGKQQKVEGSILMMAPFTDGSCYAGLHRRINVITQENVQGVVGYHFDVDPSTVGKKFKLEVTGGTDDVDLDIIFYPEFGTVEQAGDTGYAPPTYTYEERGPGGEAGVVPKGGFKRAIVCMTAGQNATFTYTAGKGVK